MKLTVYTLPFLLGLGHGQDFLADSIMDEAQAQFDEANMDIESMNQTDAMVNQSDASLDQSSDMSQKQEQNNQTVESKVMLGDAGLTYYKAHSGLECIVHKKSAIQDWLGMGGQPDKENLVQSLSEAETKWSQRECRAFIYSPGYSSQWGTMCCDNTTTWQQYFQKNENWDIMYANGERALPWWWEIGQGQIINKTSGLDATTYTNVSMNGSYFSAQGSFLQNQKVKPAWIQTYMTQLTSLGKEGLDIMKSGEWTRGFFVRPFNETFSKEFTDNVWVYWVNFQTEEVGFIDLNDKTPKVIRGTADIFIRKSDKAPSYYGNIVQIAGESWKINFYTVMYTLMIMLASFGGVIWTLKVLAKNGKQEMAEATKGKKMIILFITMFKDLFGHVTTLMYLANVKFLYPTFSVCYKGWVLFSYFAIFIDAFIHYRYVQKGNVGCLYIPIHFVLTILGIYEKFYGESADSIMSGIVFAGIMDMPIAGAKVCNNIITGSPLTFLTFVAPLMPIFKFYERITKAITYQIKSRNGDLDDENGTEGKKALLQNCGAIICGCCCCWMLVPFCAIFYLAIYQHLPDPDWTIDYTAANKTNYDFPGKPF